VCQLLGLGRSSSRGAALPALSPFALRGGQTDAHADGWGLARCQGGQWSLSLGVEPASEGPMGQLLDRAQRSDELLIAHLRRATQGGSCKLENQHPFSRELWGRQWVLAHNGHLRGLDARLPAFAAGEGPVGRTDSEAAFCWLIAELKAAFGSSRPDDETLFDALADFCEKVEESGPFNALLSDGASLFAHCSSRLSLAEVPGAVLFATEPVGDAPWRAMRLGQSAWSGAGRLRLLRDRVGGPPPSFEAPATIGAASLAASERIDGERVAAALPKAA
jgi:predicted glutamine amidotransferase